jgi:DNA-binding Xre family transcriptional regulator
MIDEELLKRIISTNLKSLMGEKCVSEISIGDETGISQSAVNRIKNGLVCPTLFQTIKIADFFKITIEQLMTIPNQDAFTEKYIPVIDSNDFIKKGETNIQGFYPASEPVANSVGFKFGSSFSCSVLNKETIVLVRKLAKHIPNGSTLLFIDKEKYKIGNYQNGYVKPIDDLLNSIEINKIRIVGAVVKIETTYIKEKSLINKIKESIGTKKLTIILENRLSFS